MEIKNPHIYPVMFSQYWKPTVYMIVLSDAVCSCSSSDDVVQAPNWELKE